MTKYFNMKTNYGIETVDQIDREDFKTYKEFNMELSRLVSEYRMAGMDVYISRKCTKEWKAR